MFFLSFSLMTQQFNCHVEQTDLVEITDLTLSNTHRTDPFPRPRLGQGHHDTYLTHDPVDVHHAQEIKQRLAVDVVKD